MAGLRPEETVGWKAFRAWAWCGVLWTAPWFTFGVGIVTLPFAGFLTWALGRYAPQPRDAWGLLFGVGALISLAGLANFNAMGWLMVLGAGLSLISIIGYSIIRRVRPSSQPLPDRP